MEDIFTCDFFDCCYFYESIKVFRTAFIENLISKIFMYFIHSYKIIVKQVYIRTRTTHTSFINIIIYTKKKTDTHINIAKCLFAKCVF